MNTEIRSDMKINGSGKASGGYYNNVIINGSGEINGDIECVDFKINGSATVKGNVKAENSKISGTANIEGNFISDEIKVNGSSGVYGNADARETKINGSLDVGGTFKGDELEIKGLIKINGDCSVEKFDLKGGFSITGLLNAGEVDAEIYGPCEAKEIGGEKIRIHQGHSFVLRKLLKSIFSFLDIKDCLTVETIEGDDIYLENTRVGIVRGNNVIIGEGCEIDLVEFKNNFQTSGNAVVKENKKSQI